MKKMIFFAATLMMAMLCACSDKEEEPQETPEYYDVIEPDETSEEPSVLPLPVVGDIHQGVKAPLYWSIYEYAYGLEKAGVKSDDMDFTEAQWDEIIDWVATNLKPHGYDMLCTDGFIPMLANDATGYMTHYGSVAIKDLVAKCKAKGLRLGIYDNPLWVHGPRDTKVQGTDVTFGQLLYDGSLQVINTGVDDLWFSWAVSENKGTEEFIDGFFRHYKELGVDFIRMDFLSWYEDGKDRGMGVVGRGYGRDSYVRALAYIANSAQKYGIFTSLVIPHLNNQAEAEAMYGNMMRIVADTGDGGWYHTSTHDMGKSYNSWPNCMNQFDGFNYWSSVSGRDKVILDGDFLRLNKYSTDAERQTAVSLQLMAGGPVAVSDLPSTIGDNLKFYTNDELLALRTDGFVGKPLSNKLGQTSETWYGEMTDGSYVVALFNRSDSSATLTANFGDLGITGEWKVRDLWSHTDEGQASSISATVPAHGCKVVRLSK